MKKILLILLLISPSLRSQTTIVTGQLQTYAMAGTKDALIVREVKRSGYLLPIRDYRPPVSNTGSFRFSIPSSVGTDTTKIRVYMPVTGWIGPNDEGVWMNVPHGANVAFSSLTPSTNISQTYPVIVPMLVVIDTAGNNGIATDTLKIGKNLQLEIVNGSPVIRSTAAGGSTDTAGTTNRPELTNAENDIKTVRDIAGAKGDSDSLKAAADTIAQHRIQIDTKQNVLTAAQKARLDSLLTEGYAINITSAGTIRIIAVDTAGWFAAWGGVMTESDPTALSKASSAIDSAFTNGARSISSTGRILVSSDSVATLSGAINIDASTGNVFRGTTTGATTATITNMLDGQSITIKVQQGGTHTFAIAGVAWTGGTAPTLTSGAGKRDVFTVIRIGGEMFGSYVQDLR